MAYSYSTRIRLTPPAGAQIVYDLSAWNWVSRQTKKDIALIVIHEMIDFSVETTKNGTQRQVFLDFMLPADSTTNESDLATILQHALNDDDWTIEISLDAGVTYREVVIIGFDESDMEDKKIGRLVTTIWQVKARQDGPIAVLGGAW